MSQKNEQRRPLPRWEAAVHITGDDDDDGKIMFNQSWLWLAGMCAVKEWAMATRQTCKVRSELPKTSAKQACENVSVEGKAFYNPGKMMAQDRMTDRQITIHNSQWPVQSFRRCVLWQRRIMRRMARHRLSY